ncbi:hypothetical protein ACR77J_04015 [Tissierella praeacuta]|uniref:hypothetical protein n=1 Tax=Tissierella praeacuta TaxID=43131 RepID=UPI003DA2E41A
MFKRFGKSSKILSLMLALIMVFGLTSTVLATGDGVLDVWAVNGNIHSTMNAVTVGGVTRYTGYIEFPENSTQDLSNVGIKAEFSDNYTLEVDGTPYTPNMSVDFSEGYVDFVLKSGSTVYRTYQINAGIDGTNVLIFVTFDLENANKWLDGTYTSPNTGGYVVPTAAAYPTAAARVQAAVTGLESGSLFIPVTANIGESAMDVFRDAVNKTDLNVIGINSGYVSEIGRGNNETLPDLLFQKTVGAPEFPSQDWEKDRTGWIYLVNDNVANMGASQYIITANDSTLTWGYTFDWGIDLGGPEW